MSEHSPGTLYVVATPIGNLEDLTYRAARVLAEVDLIAAEDTRQSRKLLNHLEIKKPLTCYFQHNEQAKGQALIGQLLAGKNIAVVSDAGTPAISDPGSEIVSLAIAAGVPVVPVPGASAVLSLLAASGLDTRRFAFEGFAPREASNRRKYLRKLAAEERTLVFYEAPHRLRAFLTDLAAIFGPRQAVIGRELTKRFEQFCRGTLPELVDYFQEQEPRGEFAIAVAGCPPQAAEPPADEQLCREVQELMAAGQSRKEAAREVAGRYALAVKQVYDLTL